MTSSALRLPSWAFGALALGTLALSPVHAAQMSGLSTPGVPQSKPQLGNTGFGPVLDRPDKGAFHDLTDTKVEVVNLNPEPLSGIAVDSDFQVWAVNPYNDTVVMYTTTTPVPALVLNTGFAPVSVAAWEPGPLPLDRKIVVVCQGTHAAFLHNSQDGRIENLVKLDSEPADVVIDPDHDWAFISCRGSNTIIKLDLPSFSILERYQITSGERPGSLYFDRGVELDPSDNRVYVVAGVTGNNSISLGTGGGAVGAVLDLDGFGAPGGLPDEDVYRIDPIADTIDPIVKAAGSLLFKVARNNVTGDLWILSTDSNNKDPALNTEPLVRGKLGTNQLVTVSGVSSLTSLVSASAGIDLDDILPGNGQQDYLASRSVNQARTLDFFKDPLGGLEGWSVIASPMSDAIAVTDEFGVRQGADFLLPAGAQCYDLEIADPFILALCLGTMTVELYTVSSGINPFNNLDLGPDPTPDQIRRGRDVFLDGQKSQDGRFTCGTCHPGAGSDQLGWAIRGHPTDVKDVMTTQSLLSIADTFPHHWRGERDLEDFKKAFRGLLGASAANDPTTAEMDDFIVFMQSLQAPANPVGSPRRILDDSLTAGAFENGMFGSAVRGQRSFRAIPNFLGRTCEECHMQQTGTNGAFFEEVGSNAPRAAELEVAHLRQLQHKGKRTVDIDLGGANTRNVNINGFGAAHSGGLPTVFNFIFDIPVFFALNDQQRADVAKFVEQFDQGISPAAHWAVWYDQNSPDDARKDVNRNLLAGAHNDWNDVAAIGRWDSGSGLQPMRWWYDPVAKVFVAEDPSIANQTWSAMINATEQGLAEHAFIGVPPRNGFRYALDRDNDGLIAGYEATIGTDPTLQDTDGDSWPDGLEDATPGDDPLVFNAASSDITPPAIDGVVELDFASSRVAKMHARFTEDVTFVVDYGAALGAPNQFSRNYFSRSDTFVLTHSEPSTPTFVPIFHDASITLTDRAGNTSGPFMLPSYSPDVAGLMVPPFPLNVHVAEMEWLTEDRVGSTLEAEVRIKINLNYGAPAWIPAENETVFCIVAVHDAVNNVFDQSTDFTTVGLATSFDTINLNTQEIETYDGLPGGPWIVSNPTDMNGETIINFMQPGLSPGQTVKVVVMGVVFEATPPNGVPPPVFNSISLFQLQPLLTEDSQELGLDF